MTREQHQQIEEVKRLIKRGFGITTIRAMGYAEAAIQIAHGRDLENIDPMGPQNHPIER